MSTKSSNPRPPTSKTTNNEVGHMYASHLTLCFNYTSHSTLTIPVREASIIITLQARKRRLDKPELVAKVPPGKWQS